MTDKEYKEQLLRDCNRDIGTSGIPMISKSYAEYVKEINRVRAQLRYLKKTVDYCRYDTSPYGNQKEIMELEAHLKDLCKLRDAAKSIEKASGKGEF